MRRIETALAALPVIFQSFAFISILVLFACLTQSQAALAQVYKVTDLGTLPNGRDTVATAINNNGDVVGYAYVGDPPSSLSYAFLWNKGVMTNLTPVLTPRSDAGSWAGNINNKGEIALIETGRVLVWKDGILTDLSAWDYWGRGLYKSATINDVGQVVAFYFICSPCFYMSYVYENGGHNGQYGTYSKFNKINNLGWVAGSYTSPDRPVLISPQGGFKQLGPGGEAVDINNSSQVIGYLTSAGGSRAFLWQNDELTDLGTLGGQSSGAGAINQSGQIVGSAQIPSGASHAFLFSNGQMIDLNSLWRQKSVG